METPTRNRKFNKRKFWFPVGVFSVVLLPLCLNLNLNKHIEKNQSFCQEVSLLERGLIHEWVFNKHLEIKLKDKKLSSAQKQYIYDKLGIDKKSNDSILYIKVITPPDFSYQDFVTFNDSLESYKFSYELNYSSISIYRDIRDLIFICGTPFANQLQAQPKKTSLNFNLTNLLILGICFPILAFFNLRNLFYLIRSRRNHFSP